eukprot:146085-Prymnesium_polylepis.1
MALHLFAVRSGYAVVAMHDACGACLSASGQRAAAHPQTVFAREPWAVSGLAARWRGRKRGRVINEAEVECCPETSRA